VVERILSKDPSVAYAAMDVASRDRYRHVIEEVAKVSGLSEDAGADRLGVNHRRAHVGFFLINRGLPELESATQERLRPVAALRRRTSQSPLSLYLGSIRGC
jgi:hypothetical protein